MPKIFQCWFDESPSGGREVRHSRCPGIPGRSLRDSTRLAQTFASGVEGVAQGSPGAHHRRDRCFEFLLQRPGHVLISGSGLFEVDFSRYCISFHYRFLVALTFEWRLVSFGPYEAFIAKI